MESMLTDVISYFSAAPILVFVAIFAAAFSAILTTVDLGV